MASIKNLKKDIDYLTSSVIADCMGYVFIAENADDQVSKIIEDIINTRNELRFRVTGGKNVPKEERKAYYKSITKDLYVKVDQAFSQLSDMIKQN